MLELSSNSLSKDFKELLILIFKLYYCLQITNVLVITNDDETKTRILQFKLSIFSLMSSLIVLHFLLFIQMSRHQPTSIIFIPTLFGSV